MRVSTKVHTMVHQVSSKLRVLVAAHVGEPVGGISVNYQTLLASSYNQRLYVRFVEISGSKLSFTERGRWRLRNWLDGLNNVLAFSASLLKGKPDLVHLAAVYGASFLKGSLMIFVARLSGVVVVLQLHCSMASLIPERNNLWHRYILFVLRYVHGVVTLSSEWDALLGLLPDAKICYVPNAINVRPYQALLRPRPDAESGLNLLFFGHIGHDKGCFDLLDAAERMWGHTQADFRMNFVGETLLSGEKEALAAQVQARNLGHFVAVHEPEYGEQKMRRLAESDVLILPSYHEGMPMSVIEAMAAGLAVVGSNVGGIPDQIVPGETGLLVPPGDVDALTDALLWLLENPQAVTAMGLAGRQRAAEYFDIETKAQALIDFYSHLVEQKQ